MPNAPMFKSKAAVLKYAKDTVCGLSDTTKMPGYSWSTSAFDCKTGSKLAAIPGTVCHGCYARKNNYRFANVQNTLRARLETASADWKAWSDNFVAVLSGLEAFTAENDRYFRWHDSGDVQSIEHLQAIVSIAERLPAWSFWLPTKEYAILRQWQSAGGTVPRNLVIRPSAPRLNQDGSRLNMGPCSSVFTTAEWDSRPAGTFACPAPDQGNQCGKCRACWSADVDQVVYHRH